MGGQFAVAKSGDVRCLYFLYHQLATEDKSYRRRRGRPMQSSGGTTVNLCTLKCSGAGHVRQSFGIVKLGYRCEVFGVDRTSYCGR
jgi:hypothetical protein